MNYKPLYEKVEVPAKVVDQLRGYECGDCGERFREEFDAKRHWGAAHAPKRTADIPPNGNDDKREIVSYGGKMLWFDSAGDASAWGVSDRSSLGTYQTGFVGPGWYVKCEIVSYDCGEADYTTTIVPIDSYETTLLGEITRLGAVVEAIRAARKP